MKSPPQWLQGLKNPIFARLYLAQTINLVGDSLTWLGLALLAFELAGEKSGTVLAGALTLRVGAFVCPVIPDRGCNCGSRRSQTLNGGDSPGTNGHLWSSNDCHNL
jgi:hypothetical protein